MTMNVIQTLVRVVVAVLILLTAIYVTVGAYRNGQAANASLVSTFLPDIYFTLGLLF